MLHGLPQFGGFHYMVNPKAFISEIHPYVFPILELPSHSKQEGRSATIGIVFELLLRGCCGIVESPAVIEIQLIHHRGCAYHPVRQKGFRKPQLKFILVLEIQVSKS